MQGGDPNDVALRIIQAVPNDVTEQRFTKSCTTLLLLKRQSWLTVLRLQCVRELPEPLLRLV